MKKISFCDCFIQKCHKYFETQNKTVQINEDFECQCGFRPHRRYDTCLISICEKWKNHLNKDSLKT